jgi:hypothetical protein
MTLKLLAIQSYEMLGLLTQQQCHIPEDLNIQQHCCDNLRTHKNEIFQILGQYLKDDTVIQEGKQFV